LPLRVKGGSERQGSVDAEFGDEALGGYRVGRDILNDEWITAKELFDGTS
jgi:hypothetical protein